MNQPRRLRALRCGAGVLGLAIAVVGCGEDGSSQDLRVVAYDEAVAREHGVVPVVADVSGIVATEAEPLIVRLLDQATDGYVWVLASDVDPLAPVVIVTSSPDDSYRPRRDEQLRSPDGEARWIEVGDPPDPTVARSVTFALGVGRIIVESRFVDLAGLRDIAAGLSVDGTELVTPSGWRIVGAYERNIFADGFATSYSSGTDDDGLSIYVDRRDGDRLVGARAAGASELVLDSGRTVYEMSTSAPGDLVDDVDPVRRIAADFGDNRLVMVNGRFSDAQLDRIVTTLREIEPDEYPIYETPEY